MIKIIKNNQILTIPALITRPNGDHVCAADLATAIECGWVEYVPPVPTPEETEAQRLASLDALIMSVCETAHHYVEREINAAGMLLVDRMMRPTPPNAKAVAVDAWVQSLYAEAETRKAHIQLGTWPEASNPCDFSSFGKKPYTVAQLWAEA